VRSWRCLVLLASLVPPACEARRTGAEGWQAPAPSSAAAIEAGARAFAEAVSADVTRDGPAAWRVHFADSPAFLMASEGALVFPNSAAATRGIQDLTRTIKRIELRWGDPLRVDPLADGLAALAMPYDEIRVDAEGRRVEERGFFTGLAEYRSGRWRFRNAHWSVMGPSNAVP